MEMQQLDYPYADVDRGVQLAVTYIAGCAITLIFVGMRLSARCSIAGIGIDDWCMVTTWVVFVPLTVIVSIFSFNGGTRHQAYLAQDPDCMEFILKMNWIAQPFAIFCLGSGKIAVSLLIIRFLDHTSAWRRWSLYISSVITAINTVLMILFTFVQCQSPSALWDLEVKAMTECWDPKIQSSFSIYGASFHAAMDFYLAAIPISLVWRLKTSLRKRIALCLLLGAGSLTGICAAIKTTKLVSLSARFDLTWETFALFLWTGIEIILCMICGSIPALKPVYAVCMGRKPLSTFRSARSNYTRKAWSQNRKRGVQDSNDVNHVAQLNLSSRGAMVTYQDNGGREYRDGFGVRTYGNTTVVMAPIRPPSLVVLQSGLVREREAVKEEIGIGVTTEVRRGASMRGARPSFDDERR